MFFIQVKVLNWVDGVEGDFLTGLTAQFGAPVPSAADQSVRFPATFVDPLDSCSNLTFRVCFSFHVLEFCNPFSCIRFM